MQHKYSVPSVVYTDASFKKGEKSVYGYTNLGGTVHGWRFDYFDNINDAELGAIKLAADKLGDEVEIITDSMTALERWSGVNKVTYRKRDHNIFDTLKRSIKESKGK